MGGGGNWFKLTAYPKYKILKMNILAYYLIIISKVESKLVT